MRGAHAQVLDARDPLGTRCRYLEHHLRKHARHKHLLLLLNKCDLVRAPPGAALLSACPAALCVCGSGSVMTQLCPYHQSSAVMTSTRWNLVSLRPCRSPCEPSAVCLAKLLPGGWFSFASMSAGGLHARACSAGVHECATFGDQ